MAAGLSKEQFRRRVYRKLCKLEGEAIKKFPHATVKRKGSRWICIFEEDKEPVTIAYVRLNASNGETAALLCVNGLHDWRNIWKRVEDARKVN